jgi:L-aspartate oxidase
MAVATAPMRADAVVVGSGLAGLLTAVDMRPMRVVLITRGALGDGSSSAWAQGGVAAALADDDSADLHAGDTVAAGAGLVDAQLAHDLAQEAPGAIARMVALGARLDRTPDGALAMGREAAHSRRRIVHANGDATGHELLRAATLAIRRAEHVQVLEFATLTDILEAGGRTAGVRFLGAAGGTHSILAPRVVIATGGLGALYRYTTNPRGQWGAGLAVAARAGARLADLEFVQFHPTALDSGVDPLPLVSEAVRGEGATIVDGFGNPIMAGLDPRGDLAPRDVVARAVYRTMRAGRRAFLDARTSPGAAFPERFGRIFAACATAGFDPRTECIPIAAAAHYHMGGIAVDRNGRTSLPGLWACGEASATGVHGANRLASNSLLEALVFARRVARDASSALSTIVAPDDRPKTSLPYETSDDWEVAARIRERMFADVGIERDGATLRAAADDFRATAALARSQQTRDMATVAVLLAQAAYDRRESRGSHFRVDYPQSNLNARRSFCELELAPCEPVPA